MPKTISQNERPEGQCLVSRSAAQGGVASLSVSAARAYSAKAASSSSRRALRVNRRTPIRAEHRQDWQCHENQRGALGIAKGCENKGTLSTCVFTSFRKCSFCKVYGRFGVTIWLPRKSRLFVPPVGPAGRLELWPRANLRTKKEPLAMGAGLSFKGFCRWRGALLYIQKNNS